MMYLQRWKLECGHLVLFGPHDDASQRRYIGQVSKCDVCPRIRSAAGFVAACWTIVDVADVDLSQYRAPSRDSAIARADTIALRA